MGWLLVGSCVVSYDAWALRTGRPTLSESARRHPVVTFVAWLGIGVHVFYRIMRG